MRIRGWLVRAFFLPVVILAIALLMTGTPTYAQCRCQPCCPNSRTSSDTDKNVYQQSEMVTVSLYNPLNYDFVLERIYIKQQRGGVVFDKEFPSTVIPGTSWTWSWNQTDNFGNQVPPGYYYLIIETKCCGAFSTSFQITCPCYGPYKPCCPPPSPCRSWCGSCCQPCWPSRCLDSWPSLIEEKTPPQGPINFSQLGFHELRVRKGILPLDELAVGDFNRDDKPDLAVTTELSNQVFIFLGRGNGCFHQTINLPLGGQPESIAVGDIVRHGPEDIIFVLPEKKDIFVLPGRGDGVFGELLTIPVQNPSTKLAVGDFNSDEFKDLAVSHHRGDLVQILLGEDHGFKQAGYTLPAENASSMVSGDFNQDESLDLVILSGNQVLMAEGKGDGTFKSPHKIQTLQSKAVQLAYGDFNNDGILDLVLMREAEGSIKILKGVGDGSFEKGTDLKTGITLKAIATGDLNGDGISDMVVIRKDSNQIIVFIAKVT